MRSASIFFGLPILLLSTTSLYDQLTKRIPSRLDTGQAPRSRFGLVPVDGFGSRRDGGGVDVVFVHGLGSNPDTTWRARRNTTGDTKERPAGGTSLLGEEEHVCWVTDFLPEDIPLAIRENSRVFFYNYDSYWQRDAVQTRLWSLGHNMLQSINSEIRRTEEERSRQLIFVGYSYGGLVVKQALLQASRNRLFENIAEHTQGVLFLGTPHSGSSFSGFGAALARMLRPLGSNPSIVDELEYDSARLLDLHREFIMTIADDLRVVNFYETRETNLLKVWFFRWNKFCVEERSATYAGSPMLVQNIGLGVDHYGLNKFGSRTAEYSMIHSKLIELLAPSPSPGWDSVPFHTASSYTAREGLFSKIKDKLRVKFEEFFGRTKPLRIGSEAPDFTTKSTAYNTDAQILPENDIHFHSYIHKKWAVFFSHPCDFTPVCTTEIVAFAEKQDEFAKRDTRLIGLSVGTVQNHKEWISDIHSNRVTTHRINFPIVADEKGEVARMYDMLDKEEHPTNEDVTECRPKLHTIRSVYIINTEKRIRAILSYPMETGRSIDEIIRVIDSLQARDEHGHHIVTPVNWQPGEDVLFRQDDEKRVKGRRFDVVVRYNLPYMKFRPLPRNQIQGYRQDPLRPPFRDLGVPTPTKPEPTAAPGVPPTSGTSSCKE